MTDKFTREDIFYRVRHELHRRPELSGKESGTARFIEERLQAYAPARIVSHVGGHGILAEYRFPGEGATLLFRADMDAVAVRELDDLPYHSLHPGIAHKCGHDGHVAILLRLARMLHERPPRRGRVLLLFQPAEENGSGSRAVLDSRVLDSYAIDRVYALHNIPGAKTHAVLCKEGSFTCAVVSVAITLAGSTAHAAEPEKGVSPVAATLRVAGELQRWNNPGTGADDYFLSTIVEIHAGEEAYGVSAGNSVIRATLRARTDRRLHEYRQRLERLVAEACEDTPGLRHGIEWLEPFSANENDREAVDAVRSAALREGLEYVEMDAPFRWGEDFGLFTQRYKGAMFGLGAGEDRAPLHSPGYDFPDEIIETGARMFYSVASRS